MPASAVSASTAPAVVTAPANPVSVASLLSTLPAHALLGRLLVLRGLLVAGWTAGIALLHWVFRVPLPLWPMAAVLGLLALFAVYTAWRLRQDLPATQLEFLAHLLADLSAFAVLVYFSGGVTNPFASLMLVPVVIAAISLRSRWVWLLAGVAGAYYALLLFVYQPLAVADPVTASAMHLGGMWFNFLISAALIAFFITRMHAGLRARDSELAALRERQLRDERILALGTQAALAAHELATPLATIQTTAHELALEFANDPDIGAECRLLERQAQVCKQILTQLAARATDRAPVRQPLDVWIAALVERWQVLRPDAHLTVHGLPATRDFAPLDGLEQAILNILGNAADVSPEAIELGVREQADALLLEIADRGPGFTAEQKARAGRVQFSGKAGRGWGMGLALTHATLERAGGTLTLTERDGGGTVVRIQLPWS
jgi:two-component system sensor histidine kinase RegB